MFPPHCVKERLAGLLRLGEVGHKALCAWPSPTPRTVGLAICLSAWEQLLETRCLLGRVPLLRS